MEQLLPVNALSRISGGIDAFAPRARTAWHTHLLGHALIITAFQVESDHPEMRSPPHLRTRHMFILQCRCSYGFRIWPFFLHGRNERHRQVVGKQRQDRLPREPDRLA